MGSTSQIRRNRLRPERFFTQADQFVTDVSASRLLKSGLEICRRHGMADSTRREATSLAAEFDEVSDHVFTATELDNVQSDRLNDRFNPLLTLAKQLIRGRTPDRPGAASTYSLLFDMHTVFERYIGNLLRRAVPAGFKVQLQLSGKSLVLKDGQPKFRLRPDAAIREGLGISVLIDTKWKLLDTSKPHDNVRQSDMYQAYAYSREYHCPRVILLYPRWQNLNPCVANYRLFPGGKDGPKIEVATIDVSGTVVGVRKQLSELIGQAGNNTSAS